MKKNILAIQMQSAIGDKKTNYAKVSSMVENFYANSGGQKLPDIIILPEVWTTGWYCDIFGELAEETSETEDFLSALCKKYDVNIIGGSYIRRIKTVSGLTCRNTCPVISRKGEVIARYEKIHLYSPDGEAKFVTSGKNPVMVDVEGINIGLSICYDIRFPELFRSYINSDFPPEFMINMSAWPKTRAAQYASMAASRAIENQCYFLALSQTGEIKEGVYNSGNSIFVSPMGETVKKLDVDEGFIFTELDLEVVKKTRETFPNLENRKIRDFGFCPEIFGKRLPCSKG